LSVADGARLLAFLPRRAGGRQSGGPSLKQIVDMLRDVPGATLEGYYDGEGIAVDGFSVHERYADLVADYLTEIGAAVADEWSVRRGVLRLRWD
jgi:hypothetical protein